MLFTAEKNRKTDLVLFIVMSGEFQTSVGLKNTDSKSGEEHVKCSFVPGSQGLGLIVAGRDAVLRFCRTFVFEARVLFEYFTLELKGTF